MKKKLILVFILLTVSTLGIIYFQVDWVRKNYHAENEKVQDNADKALREALDIYDKEHQHNVFALLQSNLKSLHDTLGVEFESDSLSIVLKDRNNREYLQRKGAVMSLGLQVRKIHVEIMAGKFVGGKLASESNYKKTEQILRRIIPSSQQLCNPLYFKSDSIKISNLFRSNLEKYGLGNLRNDVQLTFYCKETQPERWPPLATNIRKYKPHGLEAYAGNTRWVAAYFHGQSRFIISNMLGLLALSVVLMGINISSFVILLSIILQQKRLADMKDDFINNMTHELKTPIAIISAAVEGMQNFNALQDKEKTNRYLDTSRKELTRLNDLVTKVLHMASYEKKEIQLSKEKLDLNELINEIIESFKNHSDKKLNITLQCSSNVKYLEADPVHFRNAVSNIIDNAIKYSGEQVDVIINCFTEGNYLNISVADKGIGISSSQLSLIFEKFHRVPTSNLHNVKGTGLGLSYVKYVIEMHGGAVTVKSEPNKGSEFIILLPFQA